MIKQVLTFLFLIHSCLLFGQLDFSLQPVPAHGEDMADTEDFLAHTMIKNLSDQTIVIAWQRIENDLPPGWASYICSNITCAPPDVSMGTFSLTAGDSTNLDCHFLPEGNPGFGKVELRLFLVQDTSQVIFASYEGNASLVSSHVLANNPIRVYPNPATDQIYVEGTKTEQGMLYSANGTLLQKITAVKTVEVSDLPVGLYYLRLLDEHGQTLRIHPFFKTATK